MSNQYTDNPITERQAAVLRFIVAFLMRNAFPPTLREIGRHMGIESTNGVVDQLRALERKGYIERVTGVARGIRVLRDAWE